MNTDFILHLEAQAQAANANLLQGFFTRTIQKEVSDWNIPNLLFQAFGASSASSAHSAQELAAAFACLHLAIGLADDILDDEPNRPLPDGVAANLSHALLGLASVILSKTPNIGLQTRLALLYQLTSTQARVSNGQALDLQGCRDEQEYWRLAHEKSGAFFALAFMLPAQSLELPIYVLEKIQHLGELYGILVQLSDDLDDCLQPKITPDWYEPIRSLPILFASVINHPEQERFLWLRHNIQLPGNLAEAQNILLRCHALGFCLHEMKNRLAMAKQLIQSIPFQNPALVWGLFEHFEKGIQAMLSHAQPDLAGTSGTQLEKVH